MEHILRNILFILIFLSACSPTDRYYDRQMELALDEKKAHPEIKIFDGDVEPDVIDLDKINSTLQGEDSNRNGVRDDIEIWANRTVKQEYLRKRIKQNAKIQKELLVAMQENNREKVSFYLGKESNLNYCTYVYKLSREDIELKSVIFFKMWSNTEGRKILEKRHDMYYARENLPAYDPKTFKCELDLVN